MKRNWKQIAVNTIVIFLISYGAYAFGVFVIDRIKG